MTFSALRTALTMGVLSGLAIACASGGKRSPSPEPGVVTAEDIARRPGEPIERILQAKVSGIIVSRTPDGGVALQIRGATAFEPNSAPLYLIDDVPFQPGDGGALTGIDPYAIESIKVFKGAEAGIYGIRGLNGVIAIRMKKAGKR
jgi:TonB-dependent starch-binding outer membrane protein SusC